MSGQLWSWGLAAVGITAMWLAGRHPRTGWTLGMAAQALWATYAVATAQYGFLLSCTGYACVYAVNLRRALRARRATAGSTAGSTA